LEVDQKTTNPAEPPPGPQIQFKTIRFKRSRQMSSSKTQPRHSKNATGNRHIRKRTTRTEGMTNRKSKSTTHRERIKVIKNTNSKQQKDIQLSPFRRNNKKDYNYQCEHRKEQVRPGNRKPENQRSTKGKPTIITNS
jgi:hypothetical protein